MDWTNVIVRFALYLDLMLLFGLPLFALYALRREERLSAMGLGCASIAAAAAALGFVLSLFAMAVMAKSMTGASAFSELDSHVFRIIITGTDVGMAWVARMVALTVCLLTAGGTRSRPTARLAVMSAAGAVALATLAWSGHGAMDEGMRGYLHLAADMGHLAAAGAWVGALAALVLLSSPTHTSRPEQVALLSRTSHGFAHIGTAIVVTLILTGMVNYMLIVGSTLAGLWSTPYGAVLMAKLAVFGVMLALAAANRYRLSPALQGALHGGDHAAAVRALRASLKLEAACATLVLALVAGLGVLSPRPV